MAQIVDIRSFEAHRAKRPQRQGGAEILLFMGVRYERMPDGEPARPAQPERPSPGKGRRRRRSL